MYGVYGGCCNCVGRLRRRPIYIAERIATAADSVGRDEKKKKNSSWLMWSGRPDVNIKQCRFYKRVYLAKFNSVRYSPRPSAEQRLAASTSERIKYLERRTISIDNRESLHLTFIYYMWYINFWQLYRYIIQGTYIYIYICIRKPAVSLLSRNRLNVIYVNNTRTT